MFERLTGECKFHMDEWVRVTHGFYTGKLGQVVRKQFAIIPWCHVYTIDFGDNYNSYNPFRHSQLGKFKESHLAHHERPERPPMDFVPLDFNHSLFLQKPIVKLDEEKPDEKKPLQRGF